MRPSSPSLALVSAVIALSATVAAQESSPEPARDPVRAVYVGTAHPVATAPITDAVIVMQGERITAIGRAADVEVPAGADVQRFPTAHAYPGLVDAISTAFGDAYVLGDNSSDAGTEVSGGLDAYDDTSRTLTAFGVTTIGISNRGDTTWRGLGAVVHPSKDGFVPANREHAMACAEYMRISGGADTVHPLDRQRALRTVDKPFTELDEYEKTKSKHATDLAEYEKKFEEYLDHFRKQAPAAAEEAANEPSGDAPKEPREHREHRGEAKDDKSSEKSEKAADQKPPESKPAEGEHAAGADGQTPPAKAPAKPEFPKPFAPDLAREALLRVRRGELPLHVEARRAEEIRAALGIAREHALKLVLEVASEAGNLAPEIAAAGVPVIAAGFWSPVASAADAGSTLPRFTGDLPARLAKAGVEVAIASLSPREARELPLLAAYACGQGMDKDAAIAAITLTPAKILGVADTVGSLEAGKRADLLVCSGPLLDSDTRILAVLSGGEPQLEKK